MNLLQTIQWVSKIWDEIEAKLIYNCWEKTKLIKSTTSNDFQFQEDSDMDMGLWNFEAEDDCVGFIQDSDLVQIGVEQN